MVFWSSRTCVTWVINQKLLINQAANDAYLSDTNVTPKPFHRILITSSTRQWRHTEINYSQAQVQVLSSKQTKLIYKSRLYLLASREGKVTQRLRDMSNSMSISISNRSVKQPLSKPKKNHISLYSKAWPIRLQVSFQFQGISLVSMRRSP